MMPETDTLISKLDSLELNSESESNYLFSFVSAVTFNIKGRCQNAAYREFLRRVFMKLECQIYHIQECTWVPRSKFWGTVLPECHVMSHNNLEAGLAYYKGQDQPRPLGAAGVDHDRAYYQKFTTTSSTIINCDMEVYDVSGRGLMFLSFSFHGRHKADRDRKEMEIIEFFQLVINRCKKEKIPAIVGGDFNYNIRLIASDLPEVRIYGGTCPGKRSIDFLCVVCGDNFDTKMSMLFSPNSFYLSEDDIKKHIPENLVANKITNHVPYFGIICLYKEEDTTDTTDTECSTDTEDTEL